MKVIGITGGVGSGKSQVLGYLEKHIRQKFVSLMRWQKNYKKEGSHVFKKS